MGKKEKPFWFRSEWQAGFSRIGLWQEANVPHQRARGDRQDYSSVKKWPERHRRPPVKANWGYKKARRLFPRRRH